MISIARSLAGLCLLAAACHASSFICREPGGKRLIEIDGNDISPVDGKIALRIDGQNIRDRDDKIVLVVDDDDIRHSTAGVKLATFDGESIRHGPAADGKVVMNYHHPDICPTSQDNRIYSIEGDAINKQQLVAGLYLLKPDLFKLTDAETAAQQAAMKQAGEEADKAAAADQVAGAWTVLNSSGIAEHLGKGKITVAPKAGDAYPVAFDFTPAGGPAWTGAGFYEVISGDKTFFAAYGSPKTVALCKYDIAGGTLTGTWFPYYIDGTAKTIGTEVLKGKAKLEGTYTIESAKAPFTGAAYTGTVTITPLKIVGTSDDAKPYAIAWDIGGVKINGIGIRCGNQLFVASGTGADVCIAKFKIDNGSMSSDWFKLGSTEMGTSAATN